MTLNKGNPKNSNNNCIGLSLIGIILCLYTTALFAAISHLPNPTHRRRSWMERVKLPFGGSINLSRTGIEDVQANAIETGGSDNSVTKDNAATTYIPEAKWPVSIRDEDGNFEDVFHPGHKAKGRDVKMQVPKMWIDDPVSIHQNKLMTRELAMKIGSCTTPGVHGDECPLSERTIYVAIASYRDYQCRDTVTSIFERAKYPERVRVGVTDQIVEGEDGPCDAPYRPCKEDPEQMLCKYKSQIDVFQVDAPLAIGPVFARHLGHRMYRGEYYYMQSDAHVTYTRDWDMDIIGQLEATKNEMAVLSTYLSDVVGNIDKNGKSLINTRPIMCNTDYENGQNNKYLRHGSQPEAVPTIRGTPQLQPYWAAGYSFSRGHFVATTPYDFYQPMIFQGEEMSIGIRGFTIGYDFYAPERSVCFHHYAEGKNKAARNKVKHFWENTNAYAGSGVKAMYRLLGIVHMNPEIDPKEWDHTEEEKYGLGGVRTPELFYETFGIDEAEHHLCKFVETGKMHKKFTKALRKDGMGIDYDKIDYKFKDPLPNENDQDEDSGDDDEEEYDDEEE